MFGKCMRLTYLKLYDTFVKQCNNFVTNGDKNEL